MRISSTEQIARIVPDGVVMTDGTHVKLDVLVYATGFDVHADMRPMKVMGLDGLTIDEAWKEKVYSYGGIALPGFPNLFMLYGPFAPVKHVPVPLGLDQEIVCIMRLIVEARARRTALSPTVAATEKFLARLGSGFPGTVWVGGCKNWYTSRQATPVLWPFPQSEHRRSSSSPRRRLPVYFRRAVRLIRCRICDNEFIKLAEPAGDRAAIEIDDELASLHVNLRDDAKIAVVDVLVVIIFDLHHLVSRTEGPRGARHCVPTGSAAPPAAGLMRLLPTPLVPRMRIAGHIDA